MDPPTTIDGPTQSTDEAIEPIPARMLNEVVYCPRLAYLEWVQGEFATNAFVADGRVVHRRMDRERGAVARPESATSRDREGADPAIERPLADASGTSGGQASRPPPASAAPPAAGDATTTQAHAVMLASDRLGLIAKLDRVEFDGADNTATPVDAKRGRIPDNAGEARVHDPERVQLCAQALVLRDNGYACDRGVIYYAAANRRVEVPFDDDLIALTLQTLDEARALRDQKAPPPPLVDSPKCQGCSLAPICLPDETNALAGRHDKAQPLRAFAPPNPEARPLYVETSGAKVGKSGDTLTIAPPDWKSRKRPDGAQPPAKKTTIRLIDVSSLHVLGNVRVSAEAVRVLTDHDVPILWQSRGGWFNAITHSHTHKNVELRRAQFRAADNPKLCLALAQQFVAGKIRNSRTLLRRNHPEPLDAARQELTRLAGRAARAASLETLLGLEGAAARLYFSHFDGMIAAPGETFAFNFTARNRRPPRDPINALLSFAYSLLLRDVVIACYAAGFDPYLGFFHQPRYGRPSLALDLMEEFRPLIADSVVLTVINKAQVQPKHFITRGQACNLTAPGRRAFLAAYDGRLSTTIKHPIFKYTADYRRIMAVQARLLARFLLQEIDAYPPFTTR